MDRVHGRHRARIIEEMLARQGVVTVPQLTERFGASPATVRRDLARLEAEGRLRRVHGGAEAVEPAAPHGPLNSRSFHGALHFNVARKRAIARQAVGLCEDGETIIVNGGSTTYRMVEFLQGRDLAILTNSFAMAGELVARTSNRVILPGGEVYREQSVVLSPFEEDSIANHYASKMFMGAQSLGPLGLMEADPLLVRAEQRLMRQAGELVVLVDSSKFQGRGSLIVCPLARIDRVVTDDRVETASVKMLESAGIEIIVAPSEEARTSAA